MPFLAGFLSHTLTNDRSLDVRYILKKEIVRVDKNKLNDVDEQLNSVELCLNSNRCDLVGIL